MVASPADTADGHVHTRRVLVLVGPTASGKTEVSLWLARTLGGEIVSADSRQVYRFLDIGTAKPTPEQRAIVRHHFVDHCLPEQEFNAGIFGEQGRLVVDEIFGRGHLPIVVGGSGLYVQSLIDGFFDGPGADPEFRRAMNERLRNGEYPAIIEELRRVDPVSGARIDPTKPRRVIRALEVYHLTGKPLSAYHADRRVTIPFTPSLFGLAWDRKTLYDRINRRCQQMIDEGLLQEAAALAQRGYDTALNALNTVGYREAFMCLRGEIDRNILYRLFAQNSRRYAKRQMTWFRRDQRIRWISRDPRVTSEEAAAAIAALFRTA